MHDHGQHLQGAHAQHLVVRGILFAPTCCLLRGREGLVAFLKHAENHGVVLEIIGQAQGIDAVLGHDTGKSVMQEVACNPGFAQLRIE